MKNARKTFHCSPQHLREKGFTLIEVLVAIVVLGIGLVGLLSLQVMSLKMNQAALSRSIASGYAYAMIEKIRSNAVHRSDYVTALNLASSVSTTTAQTSPEELKLWAKQLDQALPGAKVQICLRENPEKTYSSGCDKSAGEFVMVRVSWQQGEDAGLMFDADTSSSSTEVVNSQSIEVVGRL
ncbi:MAG: type IV pilus modification protein PilV [Zoogloeaceae bacterium]|jgi:type IV pilus assembly protein PilV|nr:type IV pilus modification protein PilV [Zoogloeaceae bacterium]